MPARKPPARAKATVAAKAPPVRETVINTLRQVWQGDDIEDAPVIEAPVPFVAQQPVKPIPTPQPVPYKAYHWSADTQQPEWDVLSDEARQVAIDEANRAIERGASDADAITAGVIAAKLWATEHGVNVRK